MWGSSHVHCVQFMMGVLSCSCVQVLWQVDSILFCLLVLQGVCDSQGNVWRCHPAHLYMIESTIPKVTKHINKHTTCTARDHMYAISYSHRAVNSELPVVLSCCINYCLQLSVCHHDICRLPNTCKVRMSPCINVALCIYPLCLCVLM